MYAKLKHYASPKEAITIEISKIVSLSWFSSSMNMIGIEPIIAIRNDTIQAVLKLENLIKGAVVKFPSTYENSLIVLFA